MKHESIVRDDHAKFSDWAKSGFVGSPEFVDPTHSRLADVVRCLSRECGLVVDHSHATPIEFAVLLRQIVRRFKDGLNLDVVVTLPNGVDDQILARVGMTALPVAGGFKSMNASPWKPAWLAADITAFAVDASSLSPLDLNARARFLHDGSTIPADPIFTEATGNTSYRSPGQLAATRSALSIAPGSTLIVQLPTGGGKTDVAITVLKSEIIDKSRTNVLVVPTVALAMDLERRIRGVIGHVWGFEDVVLDMPLVWTGDTTPEVREVIKGRIGTGNQPILITSPETLALDDGVGVQLEIAAANGRVGWLIVDEAHIVKQWGQDFRPDFLDIAPLRNQLKRCAEQNGFEPLRTLLLSATYTPDTLEYLVEKFEDNSPIHLCAANELRAEIDIWTDVASSETERQEKFLEALHYLPRPMIVYATKPDKAKEWVELLKLHGFSRTATFSGKTVGKDRRDILQKFRNDLGDKSEFDIVVATSAFGLGVDYDQVRSVVHVCLPETVDRWYQEIGRGGRDGYKSVAVTLSCESDMSDALGLGVSVLTPETAWKRYRSISEKLVLPTKDDPALRYFNLHKTPDGVEQGSYNRRWNKQTLRGLIDLGILEQTITWWRDIPIDDREKLDQIQEDEEIRTEIMRIKIMRNLSKSKFVKIWEDWKSRELGLQNISLSNFLETLSGVKSICEMLESVYSDSEAMSQRFDQMSSFLKVYAPCGQCPNCRVSKNDLPNFSVPYPVNRLNSFALVSEQNSILDFHVRTLNRIHLEVECRDSEITECLELISKQFEFHQIDLRLKPDNAEFGVWNDYSTEMLMCTPLQSTVIIHDGEIQSQVLNLISKRIYLNSSVPVIFLGPRIGTSNTMYQTVFETFKFWITK